MTGYLPGQLLGQYEIIERIGHGGMATVYKARQPEMGRDVAIKVIESQFLADPEILARFHQEVKVISRLEHPHILPVYDFGEYDGMPFLVMRLLEGGTLSEKLKDIHLPLGEVDRIFSHLAEALSYAHEKGVIHRDVKTSNVLLDAKGNAFLTDFGIAKLTEGAQNLTSTGTITGTPSYMSPEQAMGRKVGPQADIFSLGVVLFEMLTGKVPFTAETPLAVMLRMVNEPLPAPRTIRQDIHPVIENVVMKALAKETSRRYVSVQQFLRDWKAACQEALDHPYKPDPRAPLPASQSVTQKKVAAKDSGKRKIPRVAWFLSILLIGLFAAAYYVIQTILLNPPKDGSPPGMAQVQNENLPPYIKNLIPGQQSSSAWQTWGAGNDIKGLSVFGDYLFALGPGGITVWDTTSQIYGRITTREGLPGPFVNAILPENDGSVWAATDQGVARIHQNEIQNYRPGSGTVSAIVYFQDQLLAGTKFTTDPGSGLYMFDGSSWNLMSGFPSGTGTNPGVVSPNISNLYSSPDGNLWVATDRGVTRFDGLDWQVFSSPEGLLSERVYQIFESTSGIIYAVSAEGISFFDGSRFNPFVEPSTIALERILCMGQDDQGDFWVGGEGGVARYDLSTNTWETFHVSSGIFPAETVTSITKQTNGGLFFGSDQGIISLGSDGKFQTWSVLTEISNPAVQEIITTPENSIWFVNQSSRIVDQVDPSSLLWSTIQLTETCCMIPMVFDPDGTILGGGQTGLWIISGDTTIHLTTGENLLSNTVTAVRRYGEQQLIIGTDVGVMDIDGTNIIGSFAPTQHGLPSDYVTDLLLMPDRTKWVGLRQGLIRIKTDFSREPFSYDNLFSSTMLEVSDLDYDSRGRVWVTTIGDGIYTMENDEWRHYGLEIGIPSSDVLSVFVDNSDMLWFGLGEYGAARFDGQTWQIIDRSSGLPLSTVSAVLKHVDGSIWFAGEQGIARFSP